MGFVVLYTQMCVWEGGIGVPASILVDLVYTPKVID